MLRLDEAVAELKWILTLDPVSPISYCQLGVLLMHRRECDRAAEQLRGAIELDANYSIAHWVLATTLHDKNTNPWPATGAGPVAATNAIAPLKMDARNETIPDAHASCSVVAVRVIGLPCGC